MEELKSVVCKMMWEKKRNLYYSQKEKVFLQSVGLTSLHCVS